MLITAGTDDLISFLRLNSRATFPVAKSHSLILRAGLLVVASHLPSGLILTASNGPKSLQDSKIDLPVVASTTSNLPSPRQIKREPSALNSSASARPDNLCR